MKINLSYVLRNLVGYFLKLYKNCIEKANNFTKKKE